jgi:hypothetical protein
VCCLISRALWAPNRWQLPFAADRADSPFGEMRRDPSRTIVDDQVHVVDKLSSIARVTSTTPPVVAW